MIDLTFPIDLSCENAVKELCRVAGSHITISLHKGELTFSSISPEYFKIYKMPGSYNAEDFSIRVAKRVLRPIISAGVILRITIDTSVVLRKYANDMLLVTVKSPMEQDFNSDFLKQVLTDGEKVRDEYDFSTILSLRSVVNYAQNGLQVKDGIAFLQGIGFMVYAKVEHPFNFIMTMSNIAELTAFIRAHNSVKAYECGAYAVFQSDVHYFGCRLPVNFVSDEFQQFCSMKPLAVTSANLGQLEATLQNFTLQKNESTECIFNLQMGMVSVDLGSMYHYDISIQTEPVNISFKLPTEVVKKLLSNSKLSFTSVKIGVYDSFVAIITGGVAMLISRED